MNREAAENNHAKYLYVGAALLAIGAILQAISPSLFVWLSGGVGRPAPLLGFLDLFLTLLRWSFMPLGASLIAASFVIKELGHRPH